MDIDLRSIVAIGVGILERLNELMKWAGSIEDVSYEPLSPIAGGH